MRNDVFARLQQLFSDRNLAPGDRIPPERQLAAELAVSRPSLREGLARLNDLGVLEARRGSGTYLAAIDLLDLTQVRLQFEPYAARLAAERRADGELPRLWGLLGELEELGADPVAFAAADTRLHATIVELSASPTLRILAERLADLLAFSRATTAPDTFLRAMVRGELRELVEAVERGDGPGAEQAMRRHLKRVLRSITHKQRINLREGSQDLSEDGASEP